MFLIEDESGGPGWHPVDLFDVSDNSVPTGWKFGIFPGQEDLEAVWSYQALLSIDQYEALIEREPEALAAFRAVKATLE